MDFPSIVHQVENSGRDVLNLVAFVLVLVRSYHSKSLVVRPLNFWICDHLGHLNRLPLCSLPQDFGKSIDQSSQISELTEIIKGP